jgi:hypothetical protein
LDTFTAIVTVEKVSKILRESTISLLIAQLLGYTGIKPQPDPVGTLPDRGLSRGYK